MTEDQYPWDVLDIDETDDKKLIKKAYAVLIKQYKPDEHPEEFKEIQEAYKYALLLIFDTNIAETNYNKNTKKTITLDPAYIDDSSEEKEIVDKLLVNLKEMIFSKSKDKNNLKFWKFIEEYYKIESLRLKDEVAKKVFENVAENNLYLMKVYKRLFVNPNVLIYLNEVFDWETKWQDYGLSFPQEYFIVTLDYIESKKGLGYFILVEDFLDGVSITIDKGSQKLIDIIEVPTKRFWSLVIDLVLALFVLRYVNSYEVVSKHSGSFFLLIFIGMRLPFEILTGNHSSIGKIILKLKIIDDGTGSFSIKQIFIRHIVLLVSVIPLILIFMVSSVYENTLGITIGVIIVINIILLFTHKKLIHDFISQTNIVNSK